MELEAAQYISLATFRRSGVEVATPVWAAYQDGVFYVFSAGDAGKVKRLRVSPRARVAVCDVRGKLKGPWHEARAEIITAPAEIETALAALRRKYGLAMRVADLLARLSGRMARRAYLAVRVDEVDSDVSE
jgi:PPOX class probable F420-dependent enzyme